METVIYFRLFKLGSVAGVALQYGLCCERNMPMTPCCVASNESDVLEYNGYLKGPGSFGPHSETLTSQ